MRYRKCHSIFLIKIWRFSGRRAHGCGVGKGRMHRKGGDLDRDRQVARSGGWLVGVANNTLYRSHVWRFRHLQLHRTNSAPSENLIESDQLALFHASTAILSISSHIRPILILDAKSWLSSLFQTVNPPKNATFSPAKSSRSPIGCSFILSIAAALEATISIDFLV